MDNYKTIIAGEFTFFAEWETRDNRQFMVRLYNVTDAPVKFVGKVITNDVENAIDSLIGLYTAIRETV